MTAKEIFDLQIKIKELQEKDTPGVLINFLLDKGVLQRAIECISAEEGLTSLANWFRWDATKEGHDYWNKIHEEYTQLVK